MPVIEALLSRFRRKQAEEPIIHNGGKNVPSISVSYGSGMGPARWNGRGYYAAASYGYASNADVYACISLIAQAGQQVKWWDDQGNSKSLRPLPENLKAIGKIGELYRAAEMRSKGVYNAEGELRYLKSQTSPRKSIELLTKAGGATFIHDWLSYILLAGNAYIENDPIGPMLWLDRPDRVALLPGVTPPRGRPNMWRVYNGYGGYDDRANAEAIGGPRPQSGKPWVVQSKLFNPLDDTFGMAPLDAAMYQVDTTNEGLALSKRLLQRGYAPGWIEAAEDSIWNDPQVNQLKERIRQSKLTGEEFFLENATFHEMTVPLSGAAISDNKILAKRDIAAVYHVPSQLIGDTQAQTYANYREARRALYTEAVIPLLVIFRDDWNRTVGAALQSPLDFDKDTFDAIASAREEATDRVVKTWQSGLIMQNEGRKDLEYDEVPGGDIFMLPANFVPLGSEPVPEPGPPEGE